MDELEPPAANANANPQLESIFDPPYFEGMMPYLDAVSRARLPETSRAVREERFPHQLCRPSASVFRAHKVNGACPVVYATTLEQSTGCCTNAKQQANE